MGLVGTAASAATGGLSSRVSEFGSAVKGWFSGGPKSEQVEADRLGSAGWKSLDGIPERDELEGVLKSAIGINWKAGRKNRLWTHPALYGVVVVKIGSTSTNEWNNSKLFPGISYPGVSGEDWILVVAPVGNAWLPVEAIVDFKGTGAQLAAIEGACRAKGWRPPVGGAIGGALSSVTGGLGLMGAIARLFGV